MNPRIIQRLRKLVRNAPNLLHGYNIYVDVDKLQLIDWVYQSCCPLAKSFVDLGGVWKVNGAYTIHTVRNYGIQRALLIDTDFPPGLQEKLSRVSNLEVIRGDFTDRIVVENIGQVDVAYLFDVLLHQANPSWDEVLTVYAAVASCIVIYNQQYVREQGSVRLTALPLEEYLTLAPRGREELYKYVYVHADELHPVYQKPWRDVHNIFQWGITDGDLRTQMNRLGFREVRFRNFGRFSNLPAFENHAFVFVRDQQPA